jgi:secondary thiamine-phosphate synthase enzyme
VLRKLSVSTDRRTQLVDITAQVREAVEGDAEGAAVLVYVPHTTAGVTINEHADPAVARDFEVALERIVSEDWPWQHVEEGEENAPTHIRAAFMGPQVVIPVRDGALALGTWQGIFLCEFDGPRTRNVYVTTLS